jgi:hypothetical protein
MPIVRAVDRGHLMAILGFSVHPGPLPFMTIRDAAKWESRLTNANIEIIGENGCKLPLQMVKIVSVEPYEERIHGPIPAHIRGHYFGKRLIAVWLDSLP